MQHFQAIIHPSAFQITPPPACDLKIYQYKNLQLATDQSHMASNEKRTIWALLDGYIENAAALSKELKSLGFLFATESQAELLVYAFDAWQEEFLTKLSGPFALMIFDEEKETLLIARDHIGQKNLYWSAQNHHILVANQLSGLLSTGLVPQEAADDAFATYLYFGYIPQDLTPIASVNKLLPGHFLKIHLKGQSQIGQYWSLSKKFEQKDQYSQEYASDALGDLLEKSIKTKIQTGKNNALIYTGSIASDALNWFACRTSAEHDLKTLCATTTKCAPGNGEVHCKAIDCQFIFDHLVEMVWILGEPIADPNICLTYALAKQTEMQECQFALAPLGFEEATAGNARYFFSSTEAFEPFIHKIASQAKQLQNNILHPLYHFFGNDFKYKLLRNIDIDLQQMNYLDQIALFKGKNRKKVSPRLFPYFNPEVFTQRFHNLSHLEGPIDPLLYFDSKTALPDSHLLQYDRFMSFFDTSVLSPFLDPEIIEFFAKMPIEIKFQDKKPASCIHELMQKLSGTTSPNPNIERGDFFDSFSDLEPFRDHFRLLLDGRLVDDGYLSAKWLKQHIDYPHFVPIVFKQLWSLLVLEIWFRLYIVNPISSPNTKQSVKDFLL